MFGIELMWGAMFFSMLNIAVLLTSIYIFGRIIYIYYSNNGDIEFKDIRRYVIFGFIFAIMGSFINTGAARPKITIQVPENRAQFEYKTQPREFEIVTPPPRTETLQGFTPLKQD